MCALTKVKRGLQKSCNRIKTCAGGLMVVKGRLSCLLLSYPAILSGYPVLLSCPAILLMVVNGCAYPILLSYPILSACYPILSFTRYALPAILYPLSYQPMAKQLWSPLVCQTVVVTAFPDSAHAQPHH